VAGSEFSDFQREGYRNKIRQARKKRTVWRAPGTGLTRLRAVAAPTRRQPFIPNFYLFVKKRLRRLAAGGLLFSDIPVPGYGRRVGPVSFFSFGHF